MTHEWQTALDQGGAVRALLVDFKKAFDSVNHNLLLEKLYNKNVPHQLIQEAQLPQRNSASAAHMEGG